MRNGRRSLTVLPSPIVPAEKARSSLLGIRLALDAVMEMSAYLGRRGVPVALAVPFDAKQSYATPSNVGRLLNLTHAGYGYMSRGVGFQGSLSNVDVSRTPASTT